MLFAGGNPISDLFGDEKPMSVAAQMGELMGAKIHALGGQIRFQIPREQLAGTGDERDFAGAFDQLFVGSKGLRHSFSFIDYKFSLQLVWLKKSFRTPAGSPAPRSAN